MRLDTICPVCNRERRTGLTYFLSARNVWQLLSLEEDSHGHARGSDGVYYEGERREPVDNDNSIMVSVDGKKSCA
jgi:hypothetical protein